MSKVLDRLNLSKPCKHVHLSGRRCGNRLFGNDTKCKLHRGECLECSDMKRAFAPRSGW